MNRHFPVINKRGTRVACIIMFISIVLLSVSLAKKISSGAFIWIIPVIASVIVFLLAIMILISVLTAGIDVKQGEAVFSDAVNQGGKKPQFHLKDLKSIDLHNMNGVIDNPKTADMVGARIVFTLKNGESKTYYPIQLTYKQYQSIKDGMLDMAKNMPKEKGKKSVKAKNIKKL